MFTRFKNVGLVVRFSAFLSACGMIFETSLIYSISSTTFLLLNAWKCLRWRIKMTERITRQFCTVSTSNWQLYRLYWQLPANAIVHLLRKCARYIWRATVYFILYYVIGENIMRRSLRTDNNWNSYSEKVYFLSI